MRFEWTTTLDLNYYHYISVNWCRITKGKWTQCFIVQLGKGGREYKTAPVCSNSAPRFGQAEVLTMPEGQQSLKVAAWNGSWWRCITLSSTSPQAGVQIAYKNTRHEVRGRLDVTFAGEICDMAETQTTYTIGELNWAFKKSEIVFK